MTPPCNGEEREAAYRRGYRDGWLAALWTIGDVLGQVQKHADGPLLAWQDGDCRGLVWPPELDVTPRTRRKAGGEKCLQLPLS